MARFWILNFFLFYTRNITNYCLQCGEILSASTPNDIPYCSSTCGQQSYPAQLKTATVTVSQTVTETVSESSIGINPFLAVGLFIGAVALFSPPTKRQPEVVPKGLDGLKEYWPKTTRQNRNTGSETVTNRFLIRYKTVS